MKYKIISFLLKLIILFISKSSRIKIYNMEVIEKIKKENKQIIFAFYHQELFLFIHYIKYYRYNRVAILASPSRDGDIAESVLKRFNFDIIRGSSRKWGLRGMIEMIKAIKAGSDVAFAIDGPIGPAHKTKPGILLISRRTNAVIIPISSWAVPNFKLSTWDRTLIPFPFSKACIVFGDPITPLDFKNDDIHTANQILQEILDSVSARAKKLCE